MKADVIRFQPAPPRPRRPASRRQAPGPVTPLVEKVIRLQQVRPMAASIVERMVDRMLKDKPAGPYAG